MSDLDGRLMRIPSTEAELNSTAFKKQNCIPNMGKNFLLTSNFFLNVLGSLSPSTKIFNKVKGQNK